MSAVKEFLLNQERETSLPIARERKPRTGRGSAQIDAEGGYLVINTKFASASHNPREKRQLRERLKWERLHIVRGLLRGAKSEKLQKSRTVKCMYVPVAFAVEHWKIGEEKAYLKSVVTCGTRSTCPLCNEKISAYDREELQEGLARVFAKGWFVLLITYTLRHDRFMSCAESLDKLLKAARRVKSGRRWQEIKKRYGIQGSITALENTFSFLNGHHPHKHTLEILERDLSEAEIKALRDEIAELYLAELRRVGADADFEIAVDVKRGNDYVAEYVSKFGHEPKVKSFGVSYEMSNYSGKTKGAEFGHYTMMQLVDLAGDGNEDAGKAFLDYALAFRGRWMLQWSNGLRAKLDMPTKEKTDKEKAQMSDEEKAEKRLFALYNTKAEKGFRKVRNHLADVMPDSLGKDFHAFKEYLNAKDMEVENPVFEIVDEGFDE